MIVKLNRLLLEKSIKKFGIEEQVISARALAEFQKKSASLFGSKVKNQIKPLYLKNKTIFVSVTSSVLASELKLHQKEIIEAVNKKLTKKKVVSLQFLI